jgi:hypothetical protein
MRPKHAVDISVESSDGILGSPSGHFPPRRDRAVSARPARKGTSRRYLRDSTSLPLTSQRRNRSHLKNLFNEPIATSLCPSNLKPGRRSVYDIRSTL